MLTIMKNPLNIAEMATFVASLINKDPSFTVNDLKSIRSLGKTWRKETLGNWRSSAVFLINDETMRVLVEAFQEENAENRVVGAEGDEAATGPCRDPFELRRVPFKKYRISSSSSIDQLWTYPLAVNLIERNLVWEEVISPNAVYLDVGLCFIQRVWGTFKPGLVWMLSRCENVREFAITPIQREDNKQLENEVEDRLFEAGEAAWTETVATRECELSYKNYGIRKLTLSVPEMKPRENRRIAVLPLFLQGNEKLCPKNESVASYFFHIMLRGLKVLCIQNGEEASVILKKLSSWCGNPYCYFRPTLLQSLSVFDQKRKNTLSMDHLAFYLENRGSNLRNLRVPLTMGDCMYKSRFWEGLRSVNCKLRYLALDLNCEQQTGHQSLTEAPFFMELEDCYFANLKKFVIRLDYETFRGNLIQFNLKDLRRMPMLHFFRFGTKSRVAKAWVRRKVCIDESDEKIETQPNDIKDELEAFNLKNPPYQMLDFDNGGLPLLKGFHFHGNLTNSSLLRVAKWTKNLEAVAMVFDEENVSALVDERSWPSLKKLKLLPGSCVSEQDISKLEKARPDLQIVDESEQYIPAVVEEY